MAVRYYRAAKDVLVAGSEMFVLVEIGLLAAEGKLVGLRDDYERAEQVNMLADMCRSGTNNQLHAVGNLLSYLTDHETLSSK
jgi:hypothetical protein